MAAALEIPFQSVSSPSPSRARESQTRTHDDGLSAFMSVRPRLYGIAYRMLGSAFEAEDVVQDVWVRWQTADRSVVRDAAAFLATTTTRLAINVMQSARSRRETYVGPWLSLGVLGGVLRVVTLFGPRPLAGAAVARVSGCITDEYAFNGHVSRLAAVRALLGTGSAAGEIGAGRPSVRNVRGLVRVVRLT